MTKVRFEVHESHVPLWEGDWRYAFLMGGRGNGRSGTASRYTVSRLLAGEYMRGAIMRATHADIRASSWGDINDRFTEQNITEQFRIADNEMYVERGVNSLRAHGFRASSGSLTARLKSLAGYNYVWIEEAEEIGEREFVTLDDTLRTVKGKIRIILTLNTPAKSHWIIKRWFDLDPVADVHGYYKPRLKADIKDAIYIPGTFRENLPNLDIATVERYKGYKETRTQYYWQLIEGLSPEVVVGRIYQGWQEIDDVPHEAKLLGYGLDFGFDPDPAAVVAVYYYNGGYILDEKVYQTNMLNEHLALSLKLYEKAPIIADSAEPKSIEELSSYGLNVIPCTKGPDSVSYGIKHVQGLKISYTKKSVNLKAEYENYAWKHDKQGEGLGVEDPSCENHCMSAVRYFCMEMIKTKLIPRVKTDEEAAESHFKRRLREKRAKRTGESLVFTR
jgi:phage terminase large subunit